MISTLGLTVFWYDDDEEDGAFWLLGGMAGIGDSSSHKLKGLGIRRGVGINGSHEVRRADSGVFGHLIGILSSEGKPMDGIFV